MLKKIKKYQLTVSGTVVKLTTQAFHARTQKTPQKIHLLNIFIKVDVDMILTTNPYKKKINDLAAPKKFKKNQLCREQLITNSGTVTDNSLFYKLSI